MVRGETIGVFDAFLINPNASARTTTPTHDRAGSTWNQVEDEVDCQSPDRWSNDHSLCQRHPIIGLPQCYPSDDEADCSQR